MYSGGQVPPGAFPAGSQGAHGGAQGAGPGSEMSKAAAAAGRGESTGPMIMLNVLCRELVGIHGQAPRATFAVVYLRTFRVHDWKPLGQTEVQRDRDPDFSAPIPVFHQLEHYQELRVAVFEDIRDNGEASTDSLIGAADMPFARVIAANPANPFRAPLRNVRSRDSPGSVLVTTVTGVDPAYKMWRFKIGFEDTGVAQADVPVKKAASKRKIMDFRRLGAKAPGHAPTEEPTAPPVRTQSTMAALDNSTRLVVLLSPDLDNLPADSPIRSSLATALTNVDFYTVVYESGPLQAPFHDDAEAAQQNALQGQRGGMFPDIVVSAKQITDGMENRPLYFEVHAGDEVLGAVNTSLQHLQTFKNTYGDEPLSLNPRGLLYIRSMSSGQEPSFTELLCRSDVDMSLMVAVDFTASNGNPAQGPSLHGVNQGMPNSYEAVLRTMCNLLLPLCSTESIPAYGFGAKVPPNQSTSHCFPLSGSPKNYAVQGVEGLIHAYKLSASHVQFHGPTILSDVLGTAVTIMSRKMETGHGSVPYMVLVILVDGVLSDGDTFVNTIISQAAALPLSVVIIGIGDEDFGKMHYYVDPKTNPMLRAKQVPPRNMVSFVTMRECENDLARVGARALQNLPSQVMEWWNKYRR